MEAEVNEATGAKGEMRNVSSETMKPRRHLTEILDDYAVSPGEKDLRAVSWLLMTSRQRQNQRAKEALARYSKTITPSSSKNG